MKKRLFTSFILGVASAFLIPISVEAEKSRPNILILYADDLGFGDLTSYHTESKIPTPHLDQLAATEIRFEHCHSQPICTPSRVQIMTGIYNNRNYVRFGLLDPEANTFGHLFHRVVFHK